MAEDAGAGALTADCWTRRGAAALPLADLDPRCAAGGFGGFCLGYTLPAATGGAGDGEAVGGMDLPVNGLTLFAPARNGFAATVGRPEAAGAGVLGQ